MPNFLDDLAYFARPSRMTEHCRTADLARCVAVATAFLRARAEKYVREFSGVVLFLCSAYCTPSKSRFIVTGNCEQNHIWRYGKRGIECMVARAWVYGVHSRDHVTVYPVFRLLARFPAPTIGHISRTSRVCSR